MSDLPVPVLDHLSIYGHCSKNGYWGYISNIVA